LARFAIKGSLEVVVVKRLGTGGGNAAGKVPFLHRLCSPFKRSSLVNRLGVLYCIQAIPDIGNLVASFMAAMATLTSAKSQVFRSATFSEEMH
jgi:hypothetical protein